MLMMEIRFTYLENQFRTCRNQWLVGSKQIFIECEKTNTWFFLQVSKNSIRFVSMTHYIGNKYWTRQKLKFLRTDTKDIEDMFKLDILICYL